MSGCAKIYGHHEEPLNCGQLVLNSRELAQRVWDARPENFTNGAFSQQHYANEVKHNFSHDGLPLEFYNNCWGVNGRLVKIIDPCRKATFHATRRKL